MSEVQIKNQSGNSRRYARVWGKIQGKLTLKTIDDKQAIAIGVTRNLGLNGVFLATFQPMTGLTTSSEGILELGGFPNKKSFPVHAIHWNPKGVGMRIEMAASELGETIVSLLSGDGQVRLGADLMPGEEIHARLTLDNGQSFPVRIETLNSGQFECSTTAGETGIDTGLAASVEIPFRSNDTIQTIRGECVIRKAETITSPDTPTRIRISALFSVMTEGDREKIKTIVTGLYKQRLDTLIRERATASALFEGGDGDVSQRRERKHIHGQLQTFFGFRNPGVRKNPTLDG